MFGDHGLRGLLKEYAHGKSPKCLGVNLGDFGEFCKGLMPSENVFRRHVFMLRLSFLRIGQKSLASD